MNTYMSIYAYIYTYIYMCVYACMCVYTYIKLFRRVNPRIVAATRAPWAGGEDYCSRNRNNKPSNPE